MSGDLNKPSNVSPKASVMAEIRSNAADQAIMFDNTGTANLPDRAIRYNSAQRRWEKYNLANNTWGALDFIAPEAESSAHGFTQDDLPTTVAYLDHANEYTQPQAINAPYARQYYKNGSTSGGMIGQIADHCMSLRSNQNNWDVQMDATKPSWKLNLDSATSDAFSVWRQAAGASSWTRLFKIDSSGKMTDGIVPLARMGTLIASGSVILDPISTTTVPLASGGQHNFYSWSVYSPTTMLSQDNGATNCVYLYRGLNSTNFKDFLYFYPSFEPNTYPTVYYKVYQLLEL